MRYAFRHHWHHRNWHDSYYGYGPDWEWRRRWADPYDDDWDDDWDDPY